jgi:GNAT superfamily N-acetyltransferase
MLPMDKITLRRAEKEDIPLIFSLVKELALFERAPDEVTATMEDYEINGFSDNALFDAFLLFENDQLAGFSLWYFRFSTWKGKRLYLEDLFVKSEFRSKGYGKLLMEATIAEAKATNSKGLMWQVLDWNTSAIDFYKKYGARFDSEWVNVHIDL